MNQGGNEIYLHVVENSKVKPIPTCEIYFLKKGKGLDIARVVTIAIRQY